MASYSISGSGTAAPQKPNPLSIEEVTGKAPSPGAPPTKNLNITKVKGVKPQNVKQNPRKPGAKVKYGENI